MNETRLKSTTAIRGRFDLSTLSTVTWTVFGPTPGCAFATAAASVASSSGPWRDMALLSSARLQLVEVDLLPPTSLASAYVIRRMF